MNHYIRHIIVLLLLLSHLLWRGTGGEAFAQDIGGDNDGFTSSPYCSGTLDGTTTALTLNSIVGYTSVCENASAAYRVSIATGYATYYYWTVPAGATILTGQGTNEISVAFGTTAGDVGVTAYNDCETVTATATVTLSNCNPSQTGGDNDGFVSDVACVSTLNGGLTALAINPIDGITSICENGAYAYSVSLASGYDTYWSYYYYWTVPAGATILTGQGTDTITVAFGATAGTVSVEVHNACNTATTSTTVTTTNCNPSLTGGNNDGFTSSAYCSGTLNASITPLTLNAIVGITTTCQLASEAYSVSIATGYADYYYWTVPAGASILTGQGTNAISVAFGATGGNVQVEAYNSCELTTAAAVITINACPDVCLGGDNDGFATYPYCSGSLSGTITPLTLNPVIGFTSFCEYASEAYKVSIATGYATYYYWTVPADASILTGQGTNEISVAFGATGGDVQVTAYNGCETVTATTTVTPTNCAVSVLGGVNDGFAVYPYCSGSLDGVIVPITLNPIVGYTSFCEYASEAYSISLATGYATTYTYYYWTVPAGASILTGQGTNTISVAFGATGGTIQVDVYDPCATVSATVVVATTNCAANMPGGDNDGFATYPYCSGSLNAAISSLTLNSISGTTSVCQLASASYSISIATGYATYYYWTVPSDATITTGQGTNSITVTFGTTSGDVSVTAYNACETVTQTLAVTVGVCITLRTGGDNDGFATAPYCSGTFNGTITPLALSTIVGFSTICEYTTQSFNISLTSGYTTYYYWTAPAGATILTGQGTSIVTIAFGATGGTVSVSVYNACETVVANKTVTVSSCNTSNPGGNNDGFATYPYCSGTFDGAITSLTLNPVVGFTSFCEYAAEAYSVTAATGYATYYFWTVPAGATILTGQGTNNISVAFGATGGNVQVSAYNACETATATAAVTPYSCAVSNPGGNNDGFATYPYCSGSFDGVITSLTLNPVVGFTSFCEYAAEAYSIAINTGYATYYYWTVPAGASILTGQGTNTITVAFGATGGNVQVSAYNTCETATATAAVATTNCNPLRLGGPNDGFAVDNIPASLIDLPIQLLSFTATPVENEVHLYWTTVSEINNDYFTVERCKDGIVESSDTIHCISAEVVNMQKGAGNSTITLHYSAIDAKPYSGTSYYHLKQTDYDGKESYSNWVAVTMLAEKTAISIYPNPVTDKLLLQMSSSEELHLIVEITDMLSRNVFHQTIPIFIGTEDNSKTVVNMTGYEEGVYMLTVKSLEGEVMYMKRFVKVKE